MGGFLVIVILFAAGMGIEHMLHRFRRPHGVEAVDVETLTRLADVAYGAYGEQTCGLNWQGLPMPTWVDLPAPTKAAWLAAVDAVRTEMDR